MLTKRFAPIPPKIWIFIALLAVLLLVAAAGLASSLNPVQAQSSNGKYDTDGDRLIEISNLEQLDASATTWTATAAPTTTATPPPTPWAATNPSAT